MNTRTMRASRFTFLAAVAVTGAVSRAKADDEVQVELTADKPGVRLNRVTALSQATAYGPGGSATANGMSWELVCVAPCSKRLTRNAQYFVDGQDSPSSGSFMLDAGDARLKVKAGSKGAWLGGIVLSVLGSSALVLGGTFGVLGTVSDNHPSWAAPGWTFAGLGAGALVVGIVLVKKNGTDVFTESGMQIGQTGLRLRPGGLTF